MNCHKDNKKNKSKHKHSPLKHMLHMVLCCGLPIVIIAFLPLIMRFSPSTGGVLARIVPFLCPVMMILMIPMMMGGNKNKSCCESKNNDHGNKEVAKFKQPIE
ncbi:hypothetical protein [Clostridium gasigenes]|uniref:hypothetical protein n=1 Tax=Clostridium gasigenes TaxID=94869 RepID=UPI001C0D2389|nr:hypothetical protein [Clostridium gasigenes]MBU3104513.1 hypothetical protein [Clostridium gasigenes]